MIKLKQLLVVFVGLILLILQCDSVPGDNFKLIEEANKKQKEYKEEWDKLIKDGKIVVGTEKLKSGGERPSYKFTLEEAGDLKLRDVFGMLQNWLIIAEGSKHKLAFIELPIAGETFKFRITESIFPKGQIYIQDYEGSKGIAYNDFFKKMTANKIIDKEVSQFMLELANAKLNEKTKANWEKNYSFLKKDNNQDIKNAIYEIMIVGQVAEAARPSDDSFARWKNAMTEITEVVTKTRGTKWKEMTNAIFANEKIDIKKFNYEEFYDLVTKWTAPGADKDKLWKEITDLIGEKEAKKISQDTFYTKVNMALQNVRKQEIIEFTEVTKKLKLKGRVPSSDEVFRQTLQAVVDQKGSEAKLKEFFDHTFKIYKTTQEGRYDTIFNNVIGQKPSLKRSLEESAITGGENEENPTKKFKTDPVAKARGNHDRKVINKKINTEIEGGCGKKKKRSVCEIKYKLIEDSVELSENKLSFSVLDENGIKKYQEVEIDMSELSTPKYSEELMAEHSEHIKHTPLAETIGKGIGTYGAIVNILAAAQSLSDGEYGKGVFSLTQAAHAIGGLTGVNEVVSKISRKAFQRVMSYTVEKVGLERTLERLSEAGAKALGETASKVLGRFAETLPYVGLAFDLYFIAEDIIDLTDSQSTTPLELKVAHLVLDVSVSILTLVESAFPELTPFVEPFSIALTIVRITLDDFYYDISYELSLVKGKSFGDQVLAFIRGFVEGIADVFTLGLASQLRMLDQQKSYDDQLLRNLSDLVSYFNVTFQGKDENGTEVGTVDFTAGILSQNGGFLTVKLNDDNSITVTLPDVPTENGGTTTVTKTIQFDKPVDNIVLGVGQVATPTYAKQEAKLFIFIPVKSEDIINGFDPHQSTRYGKYHGNEDDNNFYAIQGKRRRKRFYALPQSTENSGQYSLELEELQKPSQYSAYNGNDQDEKHYSTQRKQQREIQSVSKLKAKQLECYQTTANNESYDTVVYLRSYHYDLYGGGGNDRFFLGPQSARVSGDEGSDLYYLQPDGGKAVINNFALDEEQDTIFLNTSHENIQCYRSQWDLLIKYCGTHEIQLKNWFVHGNAEYHRHIFIVTQDGIGIEVTETEIDEHKIEANCNPVSIDKSRSEEGSNIVLADEFQNVKQVIGSNHTDYIYGNNNANILRGGLGDDYLEGGNGTDTYIVKKDEGIETINNYALDKKEDTLILGINYDDIKVQKVNDDLILSDSTNTAKSVTTVKLQNWFKGGETLQRQHLAMISQDYVRFTISQNSDGTPKTISLTIDFGGYKEGVILDLDTSTTNKSDKHFYVNEEVRNDVKVILDSKFDDVLKANLLGNFLSCSGGNDYLQGRGGKDVYVIDDMCDSAIINNNDTQRELDLILFKCPYESISLVALNNDLKLKCSTTQTEIVLKEWFVSGDYQHCLLKTSDKITTFLPENDNDLEESNGKLFPVEIESDEDCNNESKHIDLTLPINSKVERFAAKTDACSFNITGNSLNNYIDPGPDNPFGYQEVKGGNGTDSYMIGHSYGVFNIIDNFADDEAIDHLMFNVLFHDIQLMKEGMDVSITSASRNDSVKATLKNYFLDSKHQHILIHSVDNVIFVPTEKEPYIAVKMIDFSESLFSQVINITDSTTKIVAGSLTNENSITGGASTVKITGGNEDDHILGGPLDEDIFGLDGNDVIFGGDGNDYIFGGNGRDTLQGGEDDDVIYGGYDGDIIDGGEGSDYIVFSGENFTGVSVDLRIGSGWGSDAEGDTYTSIESILATEYDDTLFGSDDDNFLIAYGGSDYIVPGGGRDVLQGGTGNDFYDLRYAFGRKLINNFATDGLGDLVILNKTNSSSMCYFFLETDLDININYQNNEGTNFGRILADTDFLHIKISYFLRNTTYQHISFIFSDILFQYTDFSQGLTGKQLIALHEQIISGNVLDVTCSNSETSLDLVFNFTNLGNNPPYPSNYKVEYVHIEHKSIKYNTIAWPSLGGSTTVTLNNLLSGYEHKFLVTLTSCDLNVAISPEVLYTTNPSHPVGVSISDITFDGFTVSWTAPSTETDPLSNTYQYIVTITEADNAIVAIVATADQPMYTTYNLLPQKDYYVSVASIFNQTKSANSPAASAKTGKNNCKNLQHFPLSLVIEKFTKIDGIIHAHFYCVSGYSLIGINQVACNDLTNPLPTCQLITCPTPQISNAIIRKHEKNTKINCSSVAHEFCTYTLECEYGFEFNKDNKIFNTTCLESGWSPHLRTCVRTPSCSGLRAPVNGKISSTSVLVNENIKYSCFPGYQRHGPSSSQCLQRADNSTYRSPSDLPTCKSLPCPAILPQPNGIYSQNRVFYTDESVTLTCNNGYYIRNVENKPEQQILSCTANGWNVEQIHCMRSIEVINVEEKVFTVKGTLRYSFSAWRNRPVDSSLYHQACLIGGTDSTYNSISGAAFITCNRRYSIVNGPNQYTGFLQVSTTKGNEKVCVSNSLAIAKSTCNNLGYSEYTSSIVNIGSHATTLYVIEHTRLHREQRVAYDWSLGNQQQGCTKAIQCRARCPSLNLVYGNDCFSTLEKEKCYFACRAGYLLIGSSSRECLSNGQWSGTDAHCDGEAWKTDIARESRTHGGKSHSDLANYLINYLENRYDDVAWVVIVYDGVSGWDAHTVKGTYYNLFRHYGHNIVVGRITEPYHTRYPYNLRAKFSNALSVHYTTECGNWWCTWKRYRVKSRPTVEATWDNLYRQGLNPIMLHVFRGNTGGAIIASSSSRVDGITLSDGGRATLLAVAS